MTNDLNEAVTSEITPININRKRCQRLMIVLRTKGCSYARKCGGCSHCALIKNSNINVRIDNLKNQLDKEFEKYRINEFHHLDLFTLGSFFDEEEIPLEFFRYALKKVSELKTLKSVMVESRPEFIKEEKIKESTNLLKNITLEVGIGVESSNEYIRNELMNKGFSLNELENSVKILSKFNVGFAGYVLVKPVGLSEKRAIEDSISTIEYIFALGKKHNVQTRIALEPFYIPKKSPAEIKYHKREYNPVKLWSIIEIIRKTDHLGNIFVGLNDEGLSAGLVASNCDVCNSEVKEAMSQYNGDNDFFQLSELNCSCKKDWEEQVGGKNE